MIVEDERHATRFAEPAISETDVVGLDELRRRGLVGMSHHGRALVTQPAPHRVRAPGLLIGSAMSAEFFRDRDHLTLLIAVRSGPWVSAGLTWRKPQERRRAADPDHARLAWRPQ